MLLARTEGWAAGLRLAALSLAGNAEPDRFAADFSGSERTVAEYLLAEVLDRQPDHVTQLLLRTSILGRVNGPLADRLTGGSGSERILGELEQAGAFVVAIDPQRSWFRYHALFADLLKLELRRTMPDELPGLHTAAAEWFAGHEDPIEAIRHAQAAENWGLAAQLLSDHWLGIYNDGHWATAHELRANFPDRTAAGDPEFALAAAADELTRDSLEEAERYLTLAARKSDAVADDRRDRFQIFLAALRVSLARLRNDVAAVAQEAERLLVPAEAAGFLPAGLGEDLRAAALMHLGVAETWTGRFEEAEQHLEQALTLARRIERPLLELEALTHLALASAFLAPSRGEERGIQAVELARANDWTDEPFVGVAYVALGAVNLWRGRLPEAERWLERAASLRADVQHATALALHYSGALLELVRGREEEALAAFRAAQLEDALLTAHVMATSVHAHMLLAQIQVGDTDRVEHALANLDDVAHDAVQMRVVVAALHLAQDAPEDATAALAPFLDDSDAAVNDAAWAIQALVVGAIALDALRDAGGASRALERAVDLAEPDGLLLPFLLFPAPELLERHARFRTAHASLISEALDLLAGKAPTVGSGQAQPLRDPLSVSELRVLRYLPTNLPAPEIAAELFVSVNTIRTHTRHIYAKLAVHNRAEAVARARDLRLLSPSGR